MADEIEHGAVTFGSPWSDEKTPRELIRVADVVRRRITAQAPLRRAAAQVLDCLDTLANLELFLFDTGDLAKPLSAGDRWTPPASTVADEWRWHPASNPWTAFKVAHEVVGVAGAIACLRDCFTKPGAMLDDGLAARIGMLASVAADLFGESETATVHQLAAVDGRIVQPAGGRWKHAKGVSWSENELVAMQLMRNSKMTDQEIAVVAGCTRQRVAQLIKSTNAARANAALEVKGNKKQAA